MSGVYVRTFRDIMARLNEGYTALGLKSLQVLHKPENLQPDMMPYIQVIPSDDFITEEYGASIQQRHKQATMRVRLWTVYPLPDRDSDNAIYEAGYIVDDAGNRIDDQAGFLLGTGDYTGYLTWLEHLCDILNTSPDGTLNPQLANATQSMSISIGSIVKHDMTIEAVIDISVNTGSYVINNRRNI